MYSTKKSPNKYRKYRTSKNFVIATALVGIIYNSRTTVSLKNCNYSVPLLEKEGLGEVL
jgi:hypothetical protein